MNEPRHIQLLKQQFAHNPARLTEVLNRERYQSGAGETSGAAEQRQYKGRFPVIAVLLAALILKLIFDLIFEN